MRRKRKRKRRPITRTRQRYAKEAGRAWRQNQRCYIILRITDGPSHLEVMESWSNQRADCRFRMPIRFKTFGLEDRPLVRSERHYCITKEDALLADGRTLRHPLTISVGSTSSESCLWRFGGEIVFGNEEIPDTVAFCEYNAKSRRGAVIISFDGRFMPIIYTDYHHLLYDVRVFKPGEYDWLLENWRYYYLLQKF